MTVTTVFQRHEKKYLLSQGQAEALWEFLSPHMERDEYGLHTICTLYWDTGDNRCIRQREDRAVYREKLRLRSYGVPGRDSTVFLELKKKFDGVTYKRRLPLAHGEAMAYLRQGRPPALQNQVFGEIDWFVRENSPEAKCVICYDRVALYGVRDPGLRITFDSNIRCRAQALDLSLGDWGGGLLGAGEILMESKTPGSMPLWLAEALSRVAAYPVSFSKYHSVFELVSRGEVRRHAG